MAKAARCHACLQLLTPENRRLSQFKIEVPCCTAASPNIHYGKNREVPSKHCHSPGSAVAAGRRGDLARGSIRRCRQARGRARGLADIVAINVLFERAVVGAAAAGTAEAGKTKGSREAPLALGSLTGNGQPTRRHHGASISVLGRSASPSQSRPIRVCPSLTRQHVNTLA